MKLQYIQIVHVLPSCESCVNYFKQFDCCTKNRNVIRNEALSVITKILKRIRLRSKKELG